MTSRPESRSSRPATVLATALGVAAVLLPAPAVSAQDDSAGGEAVASPGPARADLRGASFRGANLREANLAGADLSGALFLGADLSNAGLWRTRLDDADLRGVVGLTRQQLSSARWAPDRPPRLESALHAFRRFWDERQVAGQDLSGANWWGADLSGFDFTGADLRRAVLIAADLRGAAMRDTDLGGACLVGADVSRTDLRGAKGLTASQLLSAKWDTRQPPVVDSALLVAVAKWQKRRFLQAELPGADLWGQDLQGVKLDRSDLRGAVLIGADLRRASLRDANLLGTVWTGADISGADFRGSRVPLARLFSARWQPDSPPVLDSAEDVLRRKFEARRMPGENLDGANLWSASLREGNFVGASLRGVVLIDADLRDASFRDADLTDANFTRADISGADFRGARGFGVAELLAARWDVQRPPALSGELTFLRELWLEKNLAGRAAAGARLWDIELVDGKLRGADLRGVQFVRGRIQGADLRDALLRGAIFPGTDLSGVDLRGARDLSLGMLLSAVWDPQRPPILDTQLLTIRKFLDKKRFEFILAGVDLTGADPRDAMGPAQPGDEVASFSLARPPFFGMNRLRSLIQERRFARVRITR